MARTPSARARRAASNRLPPRLARWLSLRLVVQTVRRAEPPEWRGLRPRVLGALAEWRGLRPRVLGALHLTVFLLGSLAGARSASSSRRFGAPSRLNGADSVRACSARWLNGADSVRACSARCI